MYLWYYVIYCLFIFSLSSTKYHNLNMLGYDLGIVTDRLNDGHEQAWVRVLLAILELLSKSFWAFTIYTA